MSENGFRLDPGEQVERGLEARAPRTEGGDERGRALGAPGGQARLDHDFDTLGQQLEALAALLSQTIASIEGLEERTGEVHPVSERLRQAANSMLGALKARSTRDKTDAG